MKVNILLKNIQTHKIIGDQNIIIDNLSQDSREEYTSRTLYFAVPGAQVDGHDYIDQVIKKGASCIICENLPEDIDVHTTYVCVTSVSEIIGSVAGNFYGNPTQYMKVIAVTGTNGKTTVATALYQSLCYLGGKAALFSTAGDFINGTLFSAGRKAGTSMEIIEFNKHAKRAFDSGCKYLCVEATSHALDQGRLNGVSINIGVFTNLTQDHLNYHVTMENYSRAKKKLFDSLGKDSYAIVNRDDNYTHYMIKDCNANIIQYTNKTVVDKTDILFSVQDFNFEGTKVIIDDILTTTKCVGLFNMYNLSAVYGCLIQLGFNKELSIQSLSQVQGARGRMELVPGSKRGIVGIVDYAHTPDALENVLQTLKQLPHNKIITVIGVGGGRDISKRPIMGDIAIANSDYVFFTSDNPRFDNPEEILQDITINLRADNFEKIIDRKKAIEKAVSFATTGDIILVAGKGHETYQDIQGVKIPFNDVDILNNIFLS